MADPITVFVKAGDPASEQTLRYLEVTGRTAEHIALVERYTKEQGLFRVDGSPIPKFTELLELDRLEG